MPAQPPEGYDQRGSGPRRPGGGYGDGYQTVNSQRGDAGWNGPDDHGADSFVPGFGGREDFGVRPDPGGRRGGDRGQDRGQDRRGDGGGRYQGEPAYGDRRGLPGADTRQGYGPGPDQDGWDDPRRNRDNWDMKHDRPRRKATRWLPRILLLVFFGALLGGGLFGANYVYSKYEAKYHPADFAGPGTGPTVTIQVVSGENAFGLAPTLVRLGIVDSARAFTNAVEASANPTALEAGFFTLNHHMQASLAYAALLNPKNRVQLGVTVPEGKRVSQVLLILSKETKIPLKNFQQVINHPAQLGLPSYAKDKVEGYLFPATYAIVPHETALQILQAMVARFNVEAQAINLPAAAGKIGLTPGQVIIEASLAQAEGGSVADFPKIAEVITNRLRIGQHLQFDSTVVYGLGKYSTSATFAELKINTPYNTYMHAGLPIGPISNPGDAAIQGILNQDKGDLLYFLTVPGGKSQFSHNPLTGQ